MVITFFNLDVLEEKYIKKKFKNYKLNFFEYSANKIDVSEYKDSDVICICPKSNLNSTILAKCTKLKYIVSRSTGVDHIDIKYCKENNIEIKNVKHYGSISVAEYQFALLLNLTRKINLVQNTVKDKGFIKEGLQGIDLFGKTIGIIGYGDIGKKVAKIANVFGMNVLVNTRTKIKNLDILDQIKYVSLNELYEQSDVISINVPYNEDTHYLINEKAFEKMKRDVIIINTARGKIIDTNSLITAISNNKIKAVALDVIEGEKYIKGDFDDISEGQKNMIKSNLQKLLSFDNVIISPHNAYNSVESIQRIFNETVKCIEEIINIQQK